eukprot:gene7216-7789_t
MDETLKLKLCISRDIHREFMRNVLGKTHYETVFGDHMTGPSVYSSASRDSIPELFHSPSLGSASYSHSIHSSANSVNMNMMSIFEFCILCDSSPSPVPGAPLKRSITIPTGSQPKAPEEINRKFTFSSPDIYECVGIVPDLVKDIPTRSPLKLDHRLGQMMLASPSRDNYPLPSSSSFSSQASPSKRDKDFFDGMIRLEPSPPPEEIPSPNSSPTRARLSLNLASASTRFDESCFQGLLTRESGDTSPTMGGGSPTLSRSTSIDKLQPFIPLRESESSIPTEIIMEGEPMSPQQSFPPPLTIQLPTQVPSPYHGVGGSFPVVAKRNPRIEKMISEIKGRGTNSPNKIEKMNSHSMSRSISKSHSFHETNNGVGGGGSGGGGLPPNMKSSSSYLEKTSNNENRHVIINPHSKNRTKVVPHSLFPTSHYHYNGGGKRYSKSGSYDLYHPPSTITRVTLEEAILHRKTLARKMREASVNKGLGRK